MKSHVSNEGAHGRLGRGTGIIVVCLVSSLSTAGSCACFVYVPASSPLVQSVSCSYALDGVRATATEGLLIILMDGYLSTDTPAPLGDNSLKKTNNYAKRLKQMGGSSSVYVRQKLEH